MNPDDKIDLTSVNKTKKQFKLPKLKNPFKKNTAGPGRDEFGQFASGSGGLLSSKKFNWKRAAPLVIVVALVGGFFVFKSFAGTYRECSLDNSSPVYSEECVTDSNEASVARLYFGIFNRKPDASGLYYWSQQLLNKRVTLTEVARQFMGSSEFKNKYGTLSNQKFVEAMYPQVFGRAPDVDGLNYWVGRLNNKTITREAMMTNFTQSTEMKRNFMYRVAQAMEIRLSSYATLVKTYRPTEVSCYGSKTTDSTTGKQACQLDFAINATNRSSVIASIDMPTTYQSGEYVACADIKFKATGALPLKESILTVSGNATESSKLSTDGPVLTHGGLGGGTGIKESSSFSRECTSTTMISPASKNIILSEEGMGFGSGRGIISLENIELYKTRVQQSFVDFQVHNNGSYAEKIVTEGTETSTVKGKLFPSKYISRSYIPSASTQPAWSADFTVEANAEYRITGYKPYRGHAIASNYGYVKGQEPTIKVTAKDASGNPVEVAGLEGFDFDDMGYKLTSGNTITLDKSDLQTIYLKPKTSGRITVQIYVISNRVEFSNYIEMIYTSPERG